MKQIIISLIILSFYHTANAHICDKIRSIQGMTTTPLFNKAIINGKSLDYYTIESKCDLSCIAYYFNKNGILYNLSANNIGVYDNNSVGTITVDKISKTALTGYLTCSSNEKRVYLPIHFSIQKNKVILDLQTEDYGVTSRLLNMSGYSRSEYARLKNELLKKSNTQNQIIGFTQYQFLNKSAVKTVKLGTLGKNGDFLLILESK